LPIISRSVIAGGIVYVSGITPDPIGDVVAQTHQVLERGDEALKRAGTDKSRLISAQAWLADMRDFEMHNGVWNKWVNPDNPPVRACVRADLVRKCLVEIMVVAAA
jgi:enamine deaminase RidA (YjgF/YER057c/UK114 family)